MRAFLLSAALFAGAWAGPALPGVPSGTTAQARVEQPATVQASDPVVLAQVAPGTAETEAVVVSAEPSGARVGLADRLWAFLADSYAREPALMIALGLVFVLSPLVSIALFLMQSTKRVIAHRHTRRAGVLDAWNWSLAQITVASS